MGEVFVALADRRQLGRRTVAVDERRQFGRSLGFLELGKYRVGEMKASFVFSYLTEG